MKDEDDGNMNMFFFLFMLPLLIISVVALLLAAVARRVGAPPIVVSCLTFPTAFLVGNCLAGGVMICGSFMVTLIMGDPAAFTWYLKNSLDLSGFFAWGPIVSAFWSFGVTNFQPAIGIPSVLLFQFAVYMLIGRFAHRIANALV
jgi:hypothetical protein